MSNETEMVDGFPRRSRIDLLTAAEKAIYDAVQAVEGLPADEVLTEAVNLLQAARDKVADHVEGVGKSAVVKVKIVSDGTPRGTIVTDMESGKIISNIESLSWEMNAKEDTSTVKLQLRPSGVEMETNVYPNKDGKGDVNCLRIWLDPNRATVTEFEELKRQVDAWFRERSPSK